MKEIELTDSAKKLEDINDWFRDFADAKSEEKLHKIEEGKRLLKYNREKLREMERELENAEREIKNKIA